MADLRDQPEMVKLPLRVESCSCSDSDKKYKTLLEMCMALKLQQVSRYEHVTPPYGGSRHLLPKSVEWNIWALLGDCPSDKSNRTAAHGLFVPCAWWLKRWNYFQTKRRMMGSIAVKSNCTSKKLKHKEKLWSQTQKQIGWVKANSCYHKLFLEVRNYSTAIKVSSFPLAAFGPELGHCSCQAAFPLLLVR